MKTDIDPSKLKVVELRAELSARGLDTKGNKAVLIDRLRDALSQEAGDESNVSQHEKCEDEAAVEETTPAEETPQEDDNAPQTRESPQKQTPTKDKNTEQSVPEESPSEVVQEKEAESMETEQQEEEQEDVEPEPVQVKKEPEVQVKEEPVEKEKAAAPVTAQQEPQVKEEPMQVERVEVKKEPQAEVKPEGRTSTRWSQVKEEINDTQAASQQEEQARGQKRQRSPSPEERSQSIREPPPRKPDDEPEIDENTVLLGWYDSDLNLVISKEKGFLSATPMHHEGFAYVWAGARASHGVTSGKVYYEVRITDNCDISHLAEQEPNPNVLRVGWSTIENSMQLGEEPLSYGYGGTGKASTNCQFKDYGKPFGLNDVVTAYLDMDSNPIHISFAVNGHWQGNAYDIPKDNLEGKALFPHILSKNCAFECFFGTGPCIKQEGETTKPAEPFLGPNQSHASYVPIGTLEPSLRVAGPKRPEKRGDCEAIMMVGLPACGKTTWANEWAKKHPGKLYNVLGTNSLIDKMKIMGLPRKRNYSGRWDVLIDKCTKCLVHLLSVAGNRRRNFIIDQVSFTGDWDCFTP
ncbi:hypothetical protein J437_LFUL012077 [Ladona fulva]|uniref:Uncharacterized protein n=1 Tax=Ladona fulva TaxID=123851 RepID=A0A8K0P316_LADFU|nr:hypothetical protein J437_LFUL012077 [Ladona fulva]